MRNTVEECFICGGTLKYYLSGKDYNSNTTSENFNIVKCTSCGLEKISPLPSYEDIISFYPKTYYSYNIKNQDENIFDKIIKLGFNSKLFGLILSRWKMGIPFNIKGKKFLDIGCGDGAIINLLKKNGWESYGFEIGGKKFENNIYYDNNFVNVDFKNLTFDFIRISHVLEHLGNPLEFLDKLKGISNKNTIIDITLPNTASFNAYIFGKYWSNRDIPRHLINYNINNLNQLLVNNGFRIDKAKYLLGFGLGGSIINVLKYKLNDKKIYKFFQNQFVSKFLLFIDFIFSLFHFGDHIGFRIKLK